MLKEVPLSGESRTKVIESLLDRGICKMDNIEAMDNLAHSVFDVLWERVESSISVGEMGTKKLFISLQGRGSKSWLDLRQRLTSALTRLA